VRQRGGSGFERRLKHIIEIAAGPADRPGERLRAPNPSMHAPWPVGPDGSRSDFRFLVSRRGSNFGGVCLGRVSERGEAYDAAHRAVRDYVQRGWQASELEPDTVAGEAAWRVRLQFPRSVLVDWLFAHAGWLFAAGVLCRSSDRESTMIERAQAVLSTWEWIEAATESGSPPPLWSTRDSIPPPAA
jgi:hypothetical protein